MPLNVDETPPQPVSWGRVALMGLPLAALFIWAYWPTLVNLAAAWDREPDYSHGYLVPPLALLFLWMRRDRFPGADLQYAWLGLALLALSVAARVFGAWVYVDAIDGWSMLLWWGGVACLLLGVRGAFWAAPSVLFLGFMVPLPFSAERLLSLPLQRVATKLSVVSLQMLGQPALSEGNVILLEDHRLEVAQACSGLRIFMGIIALAFAYVVTTRGTWWQKGLIVLAVGPIALISNAARIVITGLLYQFVSGRTAEKFSHDFAGYLMIVFAAALFGMFLWYLGKLVRVEESLDPRMGQRRNKPAPPVSPVAT